MAVDGKILFEHGDIKDLFYIASVRKSFLAALYGNYVNNGKIDLNKSLADLNIDDIGGLSDQEKEATIADLLGARSGVYHQASNRTNTSPKPRSALRIQHFSEATGDVF